MSVLLTASDEELARDFLRYVLSEDGQALWAVQRDHRTGRHREDLGQIPGFDVHDTTSFRRVAAIGRRTARKTG